MNKNWECYHRSSAKTRNAIIQTSTDRRLIRNRLNWSCLGLNKAVAYTVINPPIGALYICYHGSYCIRMWRSCITTHNCCDKAKRVNHRARLQYRANLSLNAHAIRARLDCVLDRKKDTNAFNKVVRWGFVSATCPIWVQKGKQEIQMCVPFCIWACNFAFYRCKSTNIRHV